MLPRDAELPYVLPPHTAYCPHEAYLEMFNSALSCSHVRTELQMFGNSHLGMKVTLHLQCIPQNKPTLSIDKQWRSWFCIVEYTVTSLRQTSATACSDGHVVAITDKSIDLPGEATSHLAQRSYMRLLHALHDP